MIGCEVIGENMFHIDSDNLSFISRIFLAILTSIIALDIFVLRSGSDIQLFLVSGLWLILSLKTKRGSAITIMVAMGLLLLLSMIFLFGGVSFMTERIATWLYIIIVIALFLKGFELWLSDKDEK